MDPAGCVILVPVASSIEPETDHGLQALRNRGYTVRTLRGSSQVDLARSTLATEALADGFKETMWIDSDVLFDPDDIEKLRRHKQPLTAGLYQKKTRPAAFAGKFMDGTESVTFGKGGGLIEMRYVGMGFTHVRASVYRAIEKHLEMPSCYGGYEGKKVTPYFIPSLAPEGDGWCYLSEDFSFCHRARNAGYPPMADTTIRLSHIGRYAYGWDDMAPRPTLDMLQLNFGTQLLDQPPELAKDDSTMNEQQLFEKLGRKQAVIEAQDDGYTQILNLLAGVVSGEIDRSRVLVDLTNRGWTLAAVGTRPGMPATINGLPQCVVAPAEPEAMSAADIEAKLAERNGAPVNGVPVQD